MCVDCSLKPVVASSTIGYKRLILGACYHSLNHSKTFSYELQDVVNSLVLRFPISPCILLGDFNYPNIVWSNVCPYSDTYSADCNDFVELCANFNLTQLTTQPTKVTYRTASILDHVLTTAPDVVLQMSFLPGISANLVLYFFLKVKVKRVQKNAKLIRN